MYTFGNRNVCNKVADISEEKDRLEIKWMMVKSIIIVKGNLRYRKRVRIIA